MTPKLTCPDENQLVIVNKYWCYSKFSACWSGQMIWKSTCTTAKSTRQQTSGRVLKYSLLSLRSCCYGDPVTRVILLSRWCCFQGDTVLSTDKVLCTCCTCGESTEMNETSMGEKRFKCHVSLIRPVTVDPVLRSISLISLFAALGSVPNEQLRTRKRNFSLMFHVSHCKYHVGILKKLTNLIEMLCSLWFSVSVR